MNEPWISDCGNVQLYLGDCLEVLPTIRSVDCVFTSPPYNCGKAYEEDMPLKVYWEWIESVTHICVNTISQNGSLCVNHANWMGSRQDRVYIPDELCPILSRYIPFRDHVVWDKGPASGAAWGNFPDSPRIRAQHENIYIHNSGIKHAGSDISWAEWSRFTSSIWRVSPNVDLSIHPAMMPIEIPKRITLLYTPVGGTVLDPFMGSGTTGVAAVNHGRRFIGIELNPEYFEIAKRRIMEAMGKEVVGKDGMTQRRMFT